MKEEVVLFGTCEAAQLAHFYLSYDSPYRVVAFTVDEAYIAEDTFCSLPVVPFETIESLYPPQRYNMGVTTWFSQVNRTRQVKYVEAKEKGYEMVTYISSKAVTWPGLVIGDNSFVYETAHIQPFVRIGNNVTICGGAIVGHDSVIGDNCFLAPDCVVLGHSVIEDNCFLGANSTIRDCTRVGRESVIGAGVIVLEDAPIRSVYKGAPALLLPRRSNQLNLALK